MIKKHGDPDAPVYPSPCVSAITMCKLVSKGIDRNDANETSYIDRWQNQERLTTFGDSVSLACRSLFASLGKDCIRFGRGSGDRLAGSGVEEPLLCLSTK